MTHTTAPSGGKGEEVILCVFCSEPYTDKMLEAYNGSYGCESGCEYVSIVILCESCGRKVYVKGEFGNFGNDQKKKEYTSDVSSDEIKQALASKEEYD